MTLNLFLTAGAVALGGILGLGLTTAHAADPASGSESAALPSVWQPASEAEQALIWRVVLQSPMGIAALNQLAIEGFISPGCEKTLYTHEVFESFQTLVQVQCPTPRGVSAARAYDEMRVTLNRFEDTIHDFAIERVYSD